MENYSLSDLATATGNNSGAFGGEMGFFWIFALLLLPMLSGGGLFGNGANAVSNADLQRVVDLNSIQQGQSGISADLQRGIYEINNNTNHQAYDNLGEIRDVQSVIATGFANQQNCCCQTQRAIDQVNYNGALNTASINENTTAQTQKILDAIATNRMADMQNQINQLQLQNAVSGVVRYPMASTYSSGSNPFCGCSCSAF